METIFTNVPFKKLLDTICEILILNGLEADKAKKVADTLANSTLDGINSHGVNRFPLFLEYIQKGHVSIDVEPEIVIESAELFFYPNPASNQLNLIFGTLEEKTVRFFDKSGKMIYDQKVAERVKLLEVNVSEWSNGVYFLHVESNKNGIIREKVILYH